MFVLLSDLGRLSRAVWVLLRHGALIPRHYLGSARLRVLIYVFAGNRHARSESESGLATALESLGPMYIKLGQLAATRPDVIGIRMAQELSRLKDSAPRFPISQARAALRAEFGADTEALFGSIDEAVAAASVAQVHRIETSNGPRAVKILRPDIEATLNAELRALSRAARLLYRSVPASRRMEPVAFLRAISKATDKELDLSMEAGAMDEFAIGGAREGYFFVPKVDWARSSRRVLTTEWVDGNPLTRPGALSGAERSDIARAISQGFLASALERGFFHADMHEGNMIVRPASAPGPRLALVDFGLVGRIGTKERRFLAETLNGFLKREYMLVARVHFDAGYVPINRSVADFAQALRAVGEGVFYRSSDQIPMGRLLLQLFDVTRQFGMNLRPELVLLQKTMVQVEGVARSIDPKHNIWEAAAPIVNKWVAREFGAEGLVRAASRSAADTVRTIGRLPVLIDSIQKRLDDDASAKARSGRSSAGNRALIVFAAAMLAIALAVVLHPPLGAWIKDPLH